VQKKSAQPGINPTAVAEHITQNKPQWLPYSINHNHNPTTINDNDD